MEPMMARFGSVRLPTRSGAVRCGKLVTGRMGGRFQGCFSLLSFEMCHSRPARAYRDRVR